MTDRTIYIRVDHKEYMLIPKGIRISVYSVFLSEYEGKYERVLCGNKRWNDTEWENIAPCKYNPIGYINCSLILDAMKD